MPLASAVAAELRKLADSISANPDYDIPRPYVSFGRQFAKGDKDRFLNLVRMLPRPLKKVYRGDELRMEYENGGIDVAVRIDRSEMCELVEPAKPAVYKCYPILSAEEDAELEAAHAE